MPDQHATTGAGKTFKGSTLEEKRKLINLVFQNLELKGHRLEFTLRPPFDQFVKMENGAGCRIRTDDRPLTRRLLYH